MAKYRVAGIISASVELGVYEADSPEEAEEMADDSDNWNPSLCHHCAHEVDLGDVYEVTVDKV